MAKIREELILYDKFTNTFTKYISLATQASGASNKAANSADAASRSVDRFAKSAKSSESAVSKLTGSLKSLAGAYLSFQGIKNTFSLSDQMTNTTARLSLLVDDEGSLEDLRGRVMDVANSTRSSFFDTANMVTRLGLNARAAFDNDLNQILAFTEILNKQFAINGLSAEGQSAAILQLSQAMASGALRGDELVTVMEQIPSVGRAIEKYLGIAEGGIREYAAENVISAETVKGAVFSMFEETNDQFGDMTLTWGQFATSISNTFLGKLQPALDFLSTIPQTIADNWDVAKPIIIGVLSAITAGVLALVASQIAALVTNPIGLILAGIALVTGGVYAGVDAYNDYTNSAETASGTIAGFFGEFAASAANFGLQIFELINGVVNFAVNLLRAFGNFLGNVFVDPVASIIHLLADLGIAALSVVEKVASAIDLVTGKNLSGSVKASIQELEGWANYWSDPKNNWLATGGYKQTYEIFDMDDLWEEATGWRPERFDPGMWRANAVNKGNSFESWIDDFHKNLTDGLTDSMGKQTEEMLQMIEDFLNRQNLDPQIYDDVSAIRKSVSMNEEDLKSLVDMAERQYVNNINLTSQAPVINVSGQNTGSTELDRQSLASTIRDVLLEQSASSSVRTTAWVV